MIKSVPMVERNPVEKWPETYCIIGISHQRETRMNGQLVVRTWPRRLVLPTPEFPMITTLTVRMRDECNVGPEKLSVPLGASDGLRPTERRASRVDD